jgi:hypothetical protein
VAIRGFNRQEFKHLVEIFVKQKENKPKLLIKKSIVILLTLVILISIVGSTKAQENWISRQAIHLDAVMRLVKQGKLDLEADVNIYLDFCIPDTYPQPSTIKAPADPYVRSGSFSPQIWRGTLRSAQRRPGAKGNQSAYGQGDRGGGDRCFRPEIHRYSNLSRKGALPVFGHGL